MRCTYPLSDMSTRDRNKVFRVVERCRCVRLTTSPTSVSRLSRQCTTLEVSQSYRLPRPLTRISLLFYMQLIFVSHRHVSRPPWPVTRRGSVLYVDDFLTSQETHLWAYTTSYGESFTLLYVDDVRTSQETPISSTSWYGDNFIFICNWVSHLTRNTPPGLQASYGDRFLFLIFRWCSYLSGNTATGLLDLLRGQHYFYM
jgi:hypothetical protein